MGYLLFMFTVFFLAVFVWSPLWHNLRNGGTVSPLARKGIIFSGLLIVLCGGSNLGKLIKLLMSSTGATFAPNSPAELFAIFITGSGLLCFCVLVGKLWQGSQKL